MPANRSRRPHLRCERSRYGARRPHPHIWGEFLFHGKDYLFFDQPYFLWDGGGRAVQSDDHPLQSGNYYIVTYGKLLPHAIVI